MLATSGLYAATFLVSLGSAVFPVVSLEACLFAAALAAPRGLLPLVLLCTTGDMLGKGLLYLAGTGAIRLPLRRNSARLERLRQRLEASESRGATLIFASAFAGVPPFYLLSLLAGALHLQPAAFALWGSLGRALRFGVVVALAGW
jgi:membrane protein YqaA with SNARE-associated domain